MKILFRKEINCYNNKIFNQASGTMQDWNYYFTNSMEVTIELSCEKILDESLLSQYWAENKYSLFSYIGQVNVFFFLKTSLFAIK